MRIVEALIQNDECLPLDNANGKANTGNMSTAAPSATSTRLAQRFWRGTANMQTRSLLPVAWLLIWGCSMILARAQPIQITQFGVRPNSNMNATPGLLRAIESAQGKPGQTLVFPKGRYDFWPAGALKRRFFISNHDDAESRSIALLLDGLSSFTVDGRGSDFVFHESIMPIALVHCASITLKNLSIDYATPHIIQATVVSANSSAVDLQMGPEDKYTVENGHIDIMGENWQMMAKSSLEFDAKTRGVAWNTGDNWSFYKTTAQSIGPGVVRVTGLQHQPKQGNILVLWSGDRLNPAIWVSESRDVSVSNVTVHSGQGMGFIAQKSENIHLDRFNVSLRAGTHRYVTTIADAVHFSNCKGIITVEHGLFENMLDDGINVHGSYLKITGQPSPDHLLVEFGHSQSFGFTFAAPDEHLRLVDPKTTIGYATATVKTVHRLDDKHIDLELENPITANVKDADVVENADWNPTVVYRNNHIRNNRARGVLFSTPAGVTIEDNLFDHLSGPAILMGSDAHFWFESAPSHHVVICHNRFVDPLIGKFGSSVILLSPPFRPAGDANGYGLEDVRIEDNQFRLFQRPLLYATSTEQLTFRRNLVTEEKDYESWTPSDAPVFSFNHTRCIDVSGNRLPWALTSSDIHERDAQSLNIQGIRAQDMEGCWK
jgi:hypothetical protein